MQQPSPLAQTGPVSVTVMICTRNRPRQIGACLRAVSQILVPQGSTLQVIVADNSDEGQQQGLLEAADRAGVAITYAHEPRRGYALIRNKALETALGGAGEVFIFIDDDHACATDIIEAYLTTFRRAKADVVKGIVAARPPSTPKTVWAHKIATSNVAFRRWIVEAQAIGGAGVRFDARLNLTGYEDHQFFYDAQAAGAKCVRTTLARVAPITVEGGEGASITSPVTMAFAAGRNRVYAARVRYGMMRGAFHAARLSVWRGPRGLVNHVAAQTLAALGSQQAASYRALGLQDLATTQGAITGLWRPGLDRAAAKRGVKSEV